MQIRQNVIYSIKFLSRYQHSVKIYSKEIDRRIHTPRDQLLHRISYHRKLTTCKRLRGIRYVETRIYGILF